MLLLNYICIYIERDHNVETAQSYSGTTVPVELKAVTHTFYFAIFIILAFNLSTSWYQKSNDSASTKSSRQCRPMESLTSVHRQKTKAQMSLKTSCSPKRHIVTDVTQEFLFRPLFFPRWQLIVHHGVLSQHPVSCYDPCLLWYVTIFLFIFYL